MLAAPPRTCHDLKRRGCATQEHSCEHSHYLQGQLRKCTSGLVHVVVGVCGNPQSHWIWFVFPQFKGPGRSEKAAHYAIQSLAEARAFLAHAVLGPRIRECCELLIALDGKTAHEVLGSPDDLKLASSMTLFGAVAEAGSPFEQVLAKYYADQKDARTLAVLA